MKFSVIVPVYGVERYLDQCVESVLGQTYADFELILVDDCSPDRCPAMCDAWAAKDGRIKVIHKPQNQGLGFARNTGMEAAQGEYILFLDSDDWIEADLLMESLPTLQDGQPDILVFGTILRHEDKAGKPKGNTVLLPKEEMADTRSAKAEAFIMLVQCRIFPFAWNKLYRREFLTQQGLLFEQTKLIEDFLFNIDAFTKAGIIQTKAKAYHNYRKPAHETLVSKYAPEFFALVQRKYRLEYGFLQDCGALTAANWDVIRSSYLKHIVSAVIKNRSRSAGLTKTQQKQAIREMAADPLTVEVVQDYIPASRALRMIRNAIAKKQVGRLRLYCVAIQFVQQHMLPLYHKLLSAKNDKEGAE